MIISCEKCNKKFDLADNLMPDTGRLLQCGSCSYQWHYMPKSKIELVNEIKDSNQNNDLHDEVINKTDKKTKIKVDHTKNKNVHQYYEEDIKKKKIGFFNFLLVVIISSVSLIILVDTFKIQLSYIFPNIEFYLVSLYDTLKDIFLFFSDLLK